MGESSGEQISRDVSSEAALQRILGISEVPTSVEAFPPSIHLSLAELGGKEGLPTVTQGTMMDGKERAQFVTVNPLERSDVYGVDDKKHVGRAFVKAAMRMARKRDIPLIAYHADRSVPNIPRSLFSIVDIETYAANPEMARIFAVSGQDGVEALVQVPQPKMRFWNRVSRAMQVRQFLTQNNYSGLTIPKQAQLLEQFGFKYYRYRRENSISSANPPLAGITLSEAKPVTPSH